MTEAAKRDWTRIIRGVERLMRLRSFPVAFKMLKEEKTLNEIPYLRRLHGKKVTMCQLLNLVRNSDWTVGATKEDFVSETCGSIIGLCDLPPLYKDGTFRSIVWVKTKEEAKRYEASIPRLPLGKYKAVAMAPLVYNPFEPDIVLIYANPAQMMLLINSLQFERYEVMEFFCVGESSCSDAIARCYLTGKPSLTIPCYGERRYGHAQDDELVMALRPEDLERGLRGMEALYRKGIRYPISFAGAQEDLTDAFPPSYGTIHEVERLRGDDNRLILGITGGIASGKSTVSKMLEELGAPSVDFDILARRVVEPGRPAWADIVDYFGRQVLGEDGKIDRKKLSKIVFHDLEKRKRLESFTHPRIHEEFLKEVEKITSKDPNAIIQAVIPLLIEANLQYLFHKVVVVYIPPQEQIRRLMKRDGISRVEAENILKAQIPIDEKLGYADYVIYNDGPIEKTREQVEKLWKSLKALQASRQKN